MKKILSAVLVSALMASICACDTETPVEETIPQTISTTTETTSAITESELAETTVDEMPIYSLAGMSADEISNLLLTFADVHTGDSFADYPTRFGNIEYTVGNNANYWGISHNSFDFYYDADENTTNCISQVTLQAQEEMDNTLTISNGSLVSITLYLDNYDTASELYDLLYNIMDSASEIGERYESSCSDIREGTEWRSQVFYQVEVSENDYYEGQVDIFTDTYMEGHYYCYPLYKLTMTNIDNQYRLIIELPILPTNT